MGAVLITGAAGFAGSHLLEHLAARGDRVVGWTRGDVDFTDGATVRARIGELKPSAVYHCAGAPHVAESWRDTARPLRDNVMGTHHLLDALRRAGAACRVLIPGSAYVYGPSTSPLVESDPVAPASPYALSKLAQEQLGFRGIEEDGVEVIVTRSFNHTGPRQQPAFAAPAFARQLARIEAGLDEPVLAVGNLDARRDLTDVRDVVRAYELLVARGRPGELYNVCSGEVRSMRELLDGLRARVRVPVRIAVEPSRLRPNDAPVLAGNPSKLRADTGWAPAIGFDRMLDDLLEFWRGQVRRP